jgi:hypothetical protein
LPRLRQCDSLFHESPDLFSSWSADTEGPLMTPSHFQISPLFHRVTPLTPGLFFWRKMILHLFLLLPSSLADQSLVRLFTTNSPNV